jgi:hypothetical protein
MFRLQYLLLILLIQAVICMVGLVVSFFLRSDRWMEIFALGYAVGLLGSYLTWWLGEDYL